MAILRRPGSIVEVELPSDRDEPEEERGVVSIRVPDQAFRKEMERKVGIAQRSKSQVAIDDAMRWVLGQAIVGLRNIRVLNESGKEEELTLEIDGERSASCRLTQRCYEQLAPIVLELSGLIMGCGRVSASERKNFSSPSPS